MPGAAYRGEGGAECVHWGEVIIWVKARNACGPERKVIYKDACPQGIQTVIQAMQAMADVAAEEMDTFRH